MIRQATSSHPKIPQADGAADIFDDCDTPGPSSSASGSKVKSVSCGQKKKKRNSKKNAEETSAVKAEVPFVPQVDGATGGSDDEDEDEV